MAIFYFNAQAISRSSGKNACRAAAYNARTKIVDEKTQKSYDYSERTDLARSLIFTPQIDGQNFKIDRSTLWNLVEAGEKRPDAQLARSLVLALPTEIDHQAKWLLTQKFVRDNFTDRGMIADVNIHDINSHNPHVHILLTMRDINKITPSGEIVFGLKNRTWNDKKLLERQKASWANSVNQYLELAQVPERIDHRTPTDRVPQIHIGSSAWEMEQRGIPTERGDLHRKIAEDNRTISLHRNEIAIATQCSIEIELQLEVERREREQRKQQSPLGKFIERVDRFFSNDPDPAPQTEAAIPEPKVEVRSEEPETEVDRFLRKRQEQRTAHELEAAESQRYVKEIPANNSQLKNLTPAIDPTALEREERERDTRLEVRRLANRADNQRVQRSRDERAAAIAKPQQQLDRTPTVPPTDTRSGVLPPEIEFDVEAITEKVHQNLADTQDRMRQSSIEYSEQIDQTFGALMSSKQPQPRPQAQTPNPVERASLAVQPDRQPVTLKQIIDLKNYYVKSPEGQSKPESVNAVEKFDLYKAQISRHGKAVTGDPDLKMTNPFFKTFESDQVTLSAADRTNLDSATTFAAEQAQIALEAKQAAEREPKQRNRGFSR